MVLGIHGRKLCGLFCGDSELKQEQGHNSELITNKNPNLNRNKLQDTNGKRKVRKIDLHEQQLEDAIDAIEGYGEI